MHSKNTCPFCIYSNSNIGLELWEFFRNSLLAWNATTLHLENAQVSQKIKKPRKWKIHTYHLPILYFCGWAQLFHFIRDLAHASVFTASTTGTTSLLATKQLHAQSSDGHMFTCCFTQTVQLLHKHSFITFHLTYFNIIYCKRMFSNITSVTISLIQCYENLNTLLVFSLLSLILCVWAV